MARVSVRGKMPSYLSPMVQYAVEGAEGGCFRPKQTHRSAPLEATDGGLLRATAVC